jgi:hypothetical protein
MIGQLHASVALPLGKLPSIALERQDAKAPEPRNGEKETSLLLVGEFQSFSPQPIILTLWGLDFEIRVLFNGDSCFKR